MTHHSTDIMHESARMLTTWENRKTLVWSKIAFVTNFRGRSQNTHVIGQHELANWMEHSKMSNGCSVEVLTVLYPRLRRDSDVLHPQCAACNAQKKNFN